MIDDYTIEFTLSSPDVTFLNKMALNFAFIVPKEEVERLGENFGHNPVGWFSFKLPIFPLGGVGTPAHLVLPALTAGLGGAAWYARMARSSTLDVLTADYVRTARAKGLTDRGVLLRHVLPNALNPIVTMAGMDIPWFVGGVVLVEQVFAWPGIGRMAVEAIIQVDIPLIMGTVIFTAVLVVVSSILIDLVQGIIDPRIRRAAGHAS